MLSLALELVSRLNREGLRYCHWKSTESLPRALAGEGDLDFLVQRADGERFLRILGELGFREARETGGGDQPLVLHFLGMDWATGTLLHLHVYFRLITGGALVKPIAFDVEASFVEQCTPGPAGVPVPPPELELAALVARKALEQLSPVEQLLFTKDRRQFRAELGWLMERADRGKVESILRAWSANLEPGEVWNACDALAHGGVMARVRVGLAFRHVHRVSHVPAIRAELARVLSLAGIVLRSKLGLRPRKRSMRPGGMIIAFVGPEASGKSTLSHLTAQWLGAHVAVTHCHLGKPPKGWLTRLALGALGVTRPARAALRRKRGVGAVVNGGEPTELNIPHPLITYLDARDRSAAVSRLFRQMLDGAVVITDRYPSRRPGDVDGPSARAGRPGWDRWLLKRELAIYSRIPAPDLVIMPVAPLSETLLRNRQRPDPEPEGFVRRRYALARASEHALSAVQINTTDASAEESLLEVKRRIFAGQGEGGVDQVQVDGGLTS